MSAKQNRGEWSELYAFIRLLKEGKVYAADEYVNRLEDIYFPILKIIRADEENHDVDYTTGQTVRIFKDGELLGEVSNDEVAKNAETLIETKFNAGDKVWIVVFDSVYLKFVPEYRIIDQIKIKISNGGEKFSLKYYL